MKSKRLCKGERKEKLKMSAEQSSLDIISTLPQTILETILCLLRTKEAARTSVLSKEWRYKWTKIPKLEFSHSARSILEQTSNIASTCKPCYDIHRILLLHQGPIHELTIDFLPVYDCLGLEQIMLHLLRNHNVKKLTLCGWDISYRWYKLPISVFSFHDLTDLDLSCVELGHPPIFNGFGSLRSLTLGFVGISTKSLLHLLSNCPSLKSLTLFIEVGFDETCTINELFKCLPVIEHLTTWIHVFEWLVLDSVQQELPTSLIHLKYFCFDNIFRADGYGLAFLLILIKCSPNLEKIKLQCDTGDDRYKEYSVVWEEYSNVWLEHLNELHIDCFSNTKPEMEFVKFILARSPKLKKVTIYSMVDWSEVGSNQESEMLKTLLQAPRVSPVVITVI